MLSRCGQPKKRRKTNNYSKSSHAKTENSTVVDSSLPAHERLQREVERLYDEYSAIANNDLRVADAQRAYHKYRQTRTEYHIKAYSVFGAQYRVETETKTQRKSCRRAGPGDKHHGICKLSLHQIKQMMCDDKASLYERKILSIYSTLANDEKYKRELHTRNPTFYPFKNPRNKFDHSERKLNSSLNLLLESQCLLIRRLSISKVITMEIAQYACGRIVECTLCACEHHVAYSQSKTATIEQDRHGWDPDVWYCRQLFYLDLRYPICLCSTENTLSWCAQCDSIACTFCADCERHLCGNCNKSHSHMKCDGCGSAFDFEDGGGGTCSICNCVMCLSCKYSCDSCAVCESTVCPICADNDTFCTKCKLCSGCRTLTEHSCSKCDVAGMFCQNCIATCAACKYAEICCDCCNNGCINGYKQGLCKQCAGDYAFCLSCVELRDVTEMEQAADGEGTKGWVCSECYVIRQGFQPSDFH